MRLSDCLVAYVQAKRAQNLRATTVRNYESQLRKFCRWLSDLGIESADNLDITHVRDYTAMLLDKHQTDTTVFQTQVVLKGWLVWLVQEGYIDSDKWDWRRMPLLTVDKRAPIYLTPDECRRLISIVRTTGKRSALVKHRNPTLLAMLLDTSMRKTELMNLRVDDIDLISRSVTITADNAKGRADRTVFFSADTLRLLRAYLRERERVNAGSQWLWLSSLGRRYTSRGIYSLIKQMGLRAGIGRVHVHALRHTSTTLLIQSGMPVALVQLQLGHKRLETTQRYVHLVNDDLKRHFDEHAPMNVLKGL